ncbi:uncharacterized protein LOC109797060 [Cajanus cajan]|uniref:Uncharacterized protein n=1 Tax=Cajanus cajan TaxID=3821 RepID=A0A151TQ61_CAJCA|nr:uncharacterized protein LOC109797060 [Cajanus cajan]KYP69150.1 hypothetical protein KK1_008335 [Cajanus cajan]
MGFRVLGFSLLIFIYLINLAPAYPLHNNLPSEYVQKRKFEEKEIYGIKTDGGHGSAHGSSSHGNGNSGSPDTRGGGAAVIPVYAAGAAKNRQHQTRHSAANCNLNKIKLSNVLLFTQIYSLVLLFLLI